MNKISYVEMADVFLMANYRYIIGNAREKQIGYSTTKNIIKFGEQITEDGGEDELKSLYRT